MYAWGHVVELGEDCMVFRSRPALLYMRHLQQIVELQESWRIMVEFNTSGGPGQQYQGHKVPCYKICSQQIQNQLSVSLQA
jgi:hypothetical protein